MGEHVLILNGIDDSTTRNLAQIRLMMRTDTVDRLICLDEVKVDLPFLFRRRAAQRARRLLQEIRGDPPAAYFLNQDGLGDRLNSYAGPVDYLERDGELYMEDLALSVSPQDRREGLTVRPDTGPTTLQGPGHEGELWRPVVLRPDASYLLRVGDTPVMYTHEDPRAHSITDMGSDEKASTVRPFSF